MRLRQRRAPLLATLAAVALGAALVAACAGLFETALRLDAPPQRFAGADIVIAGTEHAQVNEHAVALTERPRLPRGLADEVRSLPGVSHVDADPYALGVSTSRPDAVRAALAGRPVAVLTGDDRGRGEVTGVAAARMKLILIASIFGGMALIVMAILVASIISLAVEQRHRELALLRTIGATPRQVRRLVVGQTARPALLAAGFGALAGPALARSLFERFQDGGVVPSVLALWQGVLPIVVGALAALLVVRVAAGLAARRAGRVTLVEGLGEVEAPGRIGRVRLGLALFMVAGAVSCGAITMFMPPANASATGGGTALAGALACALVAPLLVDGITKRLSGLAARLAGVPGALAVLDLRARAHRTGALVIPVVLVASVALANVYQLTTQSDAMRSAFGGQLEDGATATRGAGWIEQPVDPSHKIDPWPLLGADPSDLAVKASAGSLDRLRGDTVALPEDLGVQVGDRIGMVLGDGARVRLEVVALLEGSSRFGSIVVPRALLDGRSAPAADFDDGLQVDTWITLAVVGVIVAYAAMSLVNALVASLSGRRRELALLRLAGATRRQIRSLLEAEALLIAAVGAIAGTAVAIAGLIPLSIATAGSPLPSGPLWVFAAVLAGIAALVLLPTLVVSRTTLRNQKVADVETL